MNNKTAFFPNSQPPPVYLRGYRYLINYRHWLNKNLTTLTDGLIAYFYENENENVRTIGLKVASGLRRYHKKILNQLESQIIRLSGPCHNSGKPISVLYIGDEISLKDLIFNIYNTAPILRENLGRCMTRLMLQAAKENSLSDDLVIFERPLGEKWIPEFGDWMVAPRWVRMVKEIPDGVSKEHIRADYLRHQKMNVKRVERLNLVSKISTEKKDFDLFYDLMFVPSLNHRHKLDASVAGRDYYRRLAQKGFLLMLLLPDGTPVAGSFNIHRNRILYALMNGCLNGDSQWLKMGVLSGLYMQILDYAVENKVRRVDIGEAHPIITNGLYIHKSNWGFSPQISPWHVTEFVFWVPHNSQAAWEWIRNNPFCPQFIKSGGNNMNRFYKEEIPSFSVEHGFSHTQD